MYDFNTEERDEEREEEGKEVNKVQHTENIEEKFNKAKHNELEKLNKSSCVNLLNETFRRHAFNTLSEGDFNCIKSKCAELKLHFSNCLTPIMTKMINDLFDELMQFQFE